MAAYSSFGHTKLLTGWTGFSYFISIKHLDWESTLEQCLSLLLLLLLFKTLQCTYDGVSCITYVASYR